MALGLEILNCSQFHFTYEEKNRTIVKNKTKKNNNFKIVEDDLQPVY